MSRPHPGPTPGQPLAYRNAQLDTHNATTLARIVAETSIEDRPVTGATAGGDERKLRGIPAIARGVPGHIPGTRP
jgi:hypothetical protein